MALSANRVIPDLIMIGLKPKKLPNGGNRIMAGNKFRNARHSFNFKVDVTDATVVPAYYGHDRREYSTNPL